MQPYHKLVLLVDNRENDIHHNQEAPHLEMDFRGSAFNSNHYSI